MPKARKSRLRRVSSKTSLGLNENVEGLLCYLGVWVTGIIFFVLEPKSRFVRFHAMQSIITFLAITIASFVFSLIPILGWIISPIISLLGFIFWIVLMIKAYQGEMYKLPYIGDLAEQQI